MHRHRRPKTRKGGAPCPARERVFARGGNRLRSGHRCRCVHGHGTGPRACCRENCRSMKCLTSWLGLWSRDITHCPLATAFSHARGCEGAGRLQQRLHVLHRARCARAGHQPQRWRCARRMQGARRSGRARNRADRHQPGVVSLRWRPGRSPYARRPHAGVARRHRRRARTRPAAVSYLEASEPADVSDKLIDVMARSNGRICRHHHLPLQSGSRRCCRDEPPYTAQQFRRW